MADQLLDVRGLKCPLPILKTRKNLSGVPVGGTLEVLTTDPGSVQDFAAFCRTSGHVLLEQGEEGGTFRYVIRRV